MERMLLPADRKKETIIRAEEDTDFNYGCIPKEREPLFNYIDKGIINLDKPAGPTSHEISSWVKRILEVKKTGHGGTLDPKVTGILPITIGSAARVSSALLTAGKEYICIAKFHKHVELNQVKSLLNLFTCEIYQRPPLISAVARILRKRRIYYMDLLEFSEDYALFRVGCQAGTYIRKLCHDFGEVLGTGANMVELRRTRSGLFQEDETLVTLHNVNDAVYLYKQEGEEKYLRKFILPMEKAVEHMNQIIIRDTAVDAICHGADLGINGVLSFHAGIEKKDKVAIMTQKGELVAFSLVLQSARKMISLHSGLVAKTKQVFMTRKIYPYWKKPK
jgi:H/ACA ribonucleoprotein complex subunit 4